MRPEEEFVGKALVDFFGGPSLVTASDGEDPPDLYLALPDSRVGIEVSRLSQFTFEPDGTMGSRATQDAFGLRAIRELNAQVGPLLANDLSFIVGVEIPVSNPARFRKALMNWVTKVATAPVVGPRHDRRIEDSNVSISVVRGRPAGNKIEGFIVNKNSSRDILLNARLVLENRIRVKSELCRSLGKPIWLALLNDFWLANAETYGEAYELLTLSHCFDRVLLVSDQGAVRELTIWA